MRYKSIKSPLLAYVSSVRNDLQSQIFSYRLPRDRNNPCILSFHQSPSDFSVGSLHETFYLYKSVPKIFNQEKLIYWLRQTESHGAEILTGEPVWLQKFRSRENTALKILSMMLLEEPHFFIQFPV